MHLWAVHVRAVYVWLCATDLGTLDFSRACASHGCTCGRGVGSVAGGSTPRGTSRAFAAVSVALGLGVVLTLAGCTAPPAGPARTPTASVSTTSSAPTPTSSALPALNPKGTAKQNLAFFDHVNNRTIAADKNPTAQQFVDGLAAAGFVKANMQMTADKTTVNLTPGSVQFSVLINGGCLIGQFGDDIGGYHSTVAPVLGTGKCLIGDTVPIQ